jgi:hypothetical protein
MAAHGDASGARSAVGGRPRRRGGIPPRCREYEGVVGHRGGAW